jgi:hypothetical protein
VVSEGRLCVVMEGWWGRSEKISDWRGKNVWGMWEHPLRLPHTTRGSNKARTSSSVKVYAKLCCRLSVQKLWTS